MSALDDVRKKFGKHQTGTRKSSRSPLEQSPPPSAGYAGSQDERFKLFAALEPRIRLMAERWQYSAAELGDVLTSARENPAGWLRAVEMDERREPEFRAAGLLS